MSNPATQQTSPPLGMGLDSWEMGMIEMGAFMETVDEMLFGPCPQDDHSPRMVFHEMPGGTPVVFWMDDE